MIYAYTVVDGVQDPPGLPEIPRSISSFRWMIPDEQDDRRSRESSCRSCLLFGCPRSLTELLAVTIAPLVTIWIGVDVLRDLCRIKPDKDGSDNVPVPLCNAAIETDTCWMKCRIGATLIEPGGRTISFPYQEGPLDRFQLTMFVDVPTLFPTWAGGGLRPCQVN